MKIHIELKKADESDCEYVYGLICLLEGTNFKYDEFCLNYMINLKNSSIDYFIIKCDEEQCGFISLYTQTLLHHNGRVCEIQEFIIEEKFRGKGIGGNVITLITEIVQKNNAVQLEVCTNKNRQSSQRFYKTNDFIETHYKYVMKFQDLF